MPLYIATIIRHSFPELSNAEYAANLSPRVQDKIKSILFGYFRSRLVRTQVLDVVQKELLTEELEQYIENFMERALEYWQVLVDGQNDENYSLRYSGSDFLNSKGKSNYKDLFLAIDAYQDDDTCNLWLVPMSLRTVESEAVINVKDN